MNILIIDDERYVVEGIMNGVDWSALPFDNRFVALNTREARKIMKEIHIDVLLCDIEMPNETGLEFMQWVRSEEYVVQVLFLTGYAEFDYAKQAMELKALEYLLKPVDYQRLTEVLRKAVKVVLQDESVSRLQQYGQQWVQYESRRKETFFRDILKRKEVMSQNEMEELLFHNGLEYTDHAKFVIAAFHAEARMVNDWRDEAMTSYRFFHTFEENLQTSELIHVETIWKERSELWIMVLRVEEEGRSLWKDLGEAAAHTRNDLKRYYTKLSICLSEETELLFAINQKVRIEEMLFNTVAYGNGVFFVCDFKPAYEQTMVIDHVLIENLLLQGQKEQLLSYIEGFINEISRDKEINLGVIRGVIVEWMQLIFLYLHKNRVVADRLFATDQYREMFEESDQSIELCKEFLVYLVEASMDYVNRIQKSDDIVLIIEKYIEDHLSENLTRDSFSDIVYLNGDYIAEVFKKERGETLIHYINKCRLQRAKELLLTSNKPVYNIALDVGYMNGSYFAKQFKETYGIEPSKYRKNSGQDCEKK